MSSLVLITTFIVWGTQFPLSKYLCESYDPILVAFLRFSLALLFLLPFTLRQLKKVSPSHMFNLMTIGIVGIGVYSILAMIGTQMSTGAYSSILINVNPLFIGVLAPLLIDEKMTAKKIFGLLCGFVGVVVLFSNSHGNRQMSGGVVVGNVLLLTSAFCIALYVLLCKRHIALYGGLITTTYTVSGGVLLLLMAFIFDIEEINLTEIRLIDWGFILYLSIVTTVLTWIVWFRSIAHFGAIKTSAFVFIIPVSGVFSSWLFLSESLGWGFLAGFLLITCGISIVQASELQLSRLKKLLFRRDF